MIDNLEECVPKLPKDWDTFNENQKREFALMLIHIIDISSQNIASMYGEIKMLREVKEPSFFYKVLYIPFYVLTMPFLVYLANYPITFPFTLIMLGLYFILGIL